MSLPRRHVRRSQSPPSSRRTNSSTSVGEADTTLVVAVRQPTTGVRRNRRLQTTMAPPPLSVLHRERHLRRLVRLADVCGIRSGIESDDGKFQPYTVRQLEYYCRRVLPWPTQRIYVRRLVTT